MKTLDRVAAVGLLFVAASCGYGAVTATLPLAAAACGFGAAMFLVSAVVTALDMFGEADDEFAD